MSEKKDKELRNTIDIPVYDVQSQFQYLIDFCKPFEFSPQALLSLILAEWIYTVQKGLLNNMSDKDIFIAYLESAQKTRKNFDKLKELMEKDNER